MKALRIFAVALLLGLLAACSREPVADMALEWRPKVDVKSVAGNLPEIGKARLQIDQLRDARQAPALIGENREHSTPRPVTTRDDVGAFVAKHLRDMLSASGVNVVEADGDVVLTGEVQQFFVVEDSIYTSQVLVSLVARQRGGHELWHRSVKASRRTFGHSYSAENYYEVLSTAVVDVAGNLLQDPDFRQALAQK